MSESIADIRKDYKMKSLLETDVKGDPLQQFREWWTEAINSKIEEVNAMTLATCTANGHPSARVVLLKGFDERGFVFFTNYQSHKAKELESNPNVALVFFWKELERQVRIEGFAEKVSELESDTYFSSRPTASQLGAWASPQSENVKDREFIEDQYLQFQNHFKDKIIPRPVHWGGYRVLPQLIEFWQGRRSRLHDRIQYTHKNNEWKMERLAP